MRIWMLLLIPVSLSGCISTPTLYPGTGLTPDLKEEGVIPLGEVTACQGAFCKKDDGGYEDTMSLPAPAAGLYVSIRVAKESREDVRSP